MCLAVLFSTRYTGRFSKVLRTLIRLAEKCWFNIKMIIDRLRAMLTIMNFNSYEKEENTPKAIPPKETTSGVIRLQTIPRKTVLKLCITSLQKVIHTHKLNRFYTPASIKIQLIFNCKNMRFEEYKVVKTLSGPAATMLQDQRLHLSLILFRGKVKRACFFI